MSDAITINRYRALFTRLGDAKARRLVDHLQVLALTRPDTLREVEAFIDRMLALDTTRQAGGIDQLRGDASEQGKR